MADNANALLCDALSDRSAMGSLNGDTDARMPTLHGALAQFEWSRGANQLESQNKLTRT